MKRSNRFGVEPAKTRNVWVLIGDTEFEQNQQGCTGWTRDPNGLSADGKSWPKQNLLTGETGCCLRDEQITYDNSNFEQGLTGWQGQGRYDHEYDSRGYTGRVRYASKRIWLQSAHHHHLNTS